MAFDYVVWLRNLQLPHDDEDREWPAIFIVLASSAQAAQRWGDTLQTLRQAGADDALFIRSSTEPHICASSVDAGTMHRCPLTGSGELPVVKDGVTASDSFIGW